MPYTERGLPFSGVTRITRDASYQAAKATALTAGTARALVYHTIRVHGPVSDQTICELTGLNPSTERPRRLELWRDALIREDGQALALDRKGGTRARTLWVVTDPTREI